MFRDLLGQDRLGIITKGTTKIAACGKDDTGYFPRIIDKSGSLNSDDVHRIFLKKKADFLSSLPPCHPRLGDAA
jgi:hypothetical protein